MVDKEGADNAKPDKKVPDKAVPAGRTARFSGVIKLAGGLAGGMLAEGGRRWRRGEGLAAKDLLLTPANARRVTAELGKLRGAAMKIGQMLSLEAGDILPPALTGILAGLQAGAPNMPVKQLRALLAANYGPNWEELFYHFDMQPVAAASIGQVHEAISADGRKLALKLQYPGVRQSIGSDVDNVALLLRMSGMLPANFDLQTLLKEAKLQLQQEADYELEAKYLQRYGQLLAGSTQFAVPTFHQDLSTRDVLAMSYMQGEALAVVETESQARRDAIMAGLMNLLFREIFEFRLVQTDPNFANYRYERHSGRIILLDFGACRAYSKAFAEKYRAFFRAAVSADREALGKAATSIGYFGATISKLQRERVLDLFVLATEPMRYRGKYDFAASGLPGRLHDVAMGMTMDEGMWHTPPTDALLLHRKLGGLLMLAARLRARVNINDLLQSYL